MNNFKRYVRIIALLCTSFIIFFTFPSLCTGQDTRDDYEPFSQHHYSQDHDRPDETPSYKYSKEANTRFTEPSISEKDETISRLWIEAFSATLIISLAPIFILFFVPVNSKLEGGSLLKIMLSFAAGGLLGDAFLHLIPHSLEPHASGSEYHSYQEHSQQHSNTGPWVLAGLFMFFIVDKCMRLIKLDHDHSHTHSAKHDHETDKKIEEKDEKIENDNRDEIFENDDKIEVAGYLNLVADFTHNFTDGLAIGASFLAGQKVGLITTFSIFCHEIPHEIGDFAILVQSGCSKKKAMLLQLLTAFGALCGTLVSLVSGGSDVGAMSSVLPFTAGGFTYIALVSIMPEVLKESSFIQSIYEIGALLLGVFIMVVVAQYE